MIRFETKIAALKNKKIPRSNNRDVIISSVTSNKIDSK